jgi:hypothetical protein
MSLTVYPASNEFQTVGTQSLQGYVAHSVEAEYVLIDSVEPRLYLLTRMIMDVSQTKNPPAK